MTRKLVVTVFAISLSVLGCGSDDGETKDAAMDTVVRLDGAKDGAKVDGAKPDTVLADTAKVDVTPDSKPADTAKVDGGVADVPVSPDAPLQADTGVVTGSDAADGGSVD